MTTFPFDKRPTAALRGPSSVAPASEDQMQAQVMDVAPELAQQFLNSLAPYQRPLSTRHVAHLEADMRAGRWIPNGSPLRFDVLGRLCDGQHRLTAAVLAGFTLRSCVIVHQLPVEANGTIDTTAMTRSAIQIAHTRHLYAVAPNASTLAAVALEKYHFEAWRMKDQCTATERAQLWEALPAEQQEQMRKLEGVQRAKRINNRAILACALRCIRADARALEFFTLTFSNHEDAPPAARLLYNTLTKVTRVGVSDLDNAWIAMRAFVAHLRGERLQFLKPPQDWPLEHRTPASFGTRSREK